MREATLMPPERLTYIKVDRAQFVDNWLTFIENELLCSSAIEIILIERGGKLLLWHLSFYAIIDLLFVK